MIPDENKLGTYVRHLRDNGIIDAVGDWRENDGSKEFGVRVGGVFYSVSELRSEKNRTAVLTRDFAAVRANRPLAFYAKRRIHRVDSSARTETRGTDK